MFWKFILPNTNEYEDSLDSLMSSVPQGGGYFLCNPVLREIYYRLSFGK